MFSRIVKIGLIFFILSLVPNIAYSYDKVKVGYYKVMPGLIYFVAEENGYFKEQGLTLEKVEFKTSNQLSEAVAANRIDVGMGPALFPILGIEVNNPGRIKIFATLDESSNPELIISKLVVPVNSDIDKISDLKGKTIGVFPGVATPTHAKCAFRKFLAPGDYKTIQIPPPLQMQALKQGQVDALFVLEPVPAQCEVNNIGKVIEDGLLGKYIFEPMVGGAYVFSTRFLENEPKLANKMKKAIYKAIDWIRNNEKKSRKILAEYLPISEKVALESSRNKLDKVSLEKDEKKIQRMIDFYYKEGVLSEKIDAGNLLVEE